MGSPSSSSAATAATPGRRAVGEQVGLVLGEGVQLVQQPREAAALAEVVGRRPSGSGTWTRLRGSPNSDTLPVATSKLATIIVSAAPAGSARRRRPAAAP